VSDRPIRVVHVIAQIGVGGAEKQLRELVVHSNADLVNHQVLYYSDSLDTEEFKFYNEAGISLARVPRDKHHPFRFLRDLAAAIRHRRPDIVHCWLTGASFWGRLAALRAGVRRIVVAFRAAEVEQALALRTLEWLTKQRVCHLANSRGCANSVAKTLRLPPERFRVIPNGIDIRRFSPRDDRDQLLRELGLSNDHKLVVSVGRLTAAKNYPMLLRIAQRSKGRLPVRFLIVGHGERETELRAMANDLGVTDIVYFLGLRHDVARILKAADIFCFCSLREGFPNALLEAMATGLPIVTTCFAGADELIEDGANGRLIRMNDDAVGYDAIKAYLDDPSLAQRMANNARRTAGERFSMERMVNSTTALYAELLRQIP